MNPQDPKKPDKNILKLLIVTYDFPPMGGTGVQRVTSLVKYLPHYGIQPIVLTIHNRNRTDLVEVETQVQIPASVAVYSSFCLDFYTIFQKINPGLMKGKYREITDYKRARKPSKLTRIVDIYNRIMVPDPKVLWAPFAYKKAKAIFSKNKIDAVFSTSPRATAHLIAYLISKKYKVPMISDFRDPWTQARLETRRPFPFKTIDLMLERMVVQNSSAVISVTGEINRDFIRRYGPYGKDKFVVVTNGFDQEEFETVEPYHYDHFTIVYAGKNYDGKGNIPGFLDRLSSVRQGHRLDIRFHYIGSDHRTIEAYAKTHRFDFVHATPFMPHRKVIGFFKGAGALYLCQHAERIPPLTSKLFEYIGAQRPIIALTEKNSEMARILTRTKSGFVFQADDDSTLVRFLKQQYEAYCDGKGPKHINNDDLIVEYDRKYLAGKIAFLIRDAIDSGIQGQ